MAEGPEGAEIVQCKATTQRSTAPSERNKFGKIMQLVTSLDQIIANMVTFDAHRPGSQIGDTADYLALVKRGTCFLPYLTAGELPFAPSRLIGYESNSMVTHAANESRDGRAYQRYDRTNPGTTAT